MRNTICPNCGGEYGQVTLHWKRSDCQFPEFSSDQMEILSGLLLGDADIKPGTDGSIFRLRITNKDFLDQLDEFLGPLSRGVRLHDTGQEKFKKSVGVLKGTSESSEFSDMYGLRTVTHEQINELRDWYVGGKKVMPEEISNKMFKYWYICDGWNHENTSVRIRAKIPDDLEHVADNVEKNSYLEASSVSTSKGVIRMTAESSREFWRRTEPVTGFEYKWEEDV